MKLWTRRLVLPAAAAALCLLSGPARATTTPNGGPGLGAYLEALEAVWDTLEDHDSAEGKAIFAAMRHFEDPSRTYSEDITDFRKGIPKMRKAFGTDITHETHGVTAKIVSDHVLLTGGMVQVLGGRTYLGDLRGTFSFAKRYAAAMKPTNEVKRLTKLAALMASVQAAAKRKHVDLYSGT